MALIHTVLSLLLLQSIASNADRKDGDYIIGAILPVHNATGGNCTEIDYQGLAVSEAIRFAVEEINSDHKLLGKLTVKRTLGYDVRDSCGGIEAEKDIAYSFNDALRKHKTSPAASPKPVVAVISQFQKRSAEVVELLKFEGIPQLSYDSANANLLRDGASDKELSDLLSMYPEDGSKARVIADVLEAMKVEYTSIMTKDDARGRAWLAEMKKSLDKLDRCYSNDMLMKSSNDVKRGILMLGLNRNAKVAAIYGGNDDDLVAFKEAKLLNMTGVVWISTSSWRERLDELRPYARQVEGMVTVETNKPDPQGFKAYIADDSKALLKNSAWYKEALAKVGSKATLRAKLLKYSDAAAYAIDAVYTIAHGIQAQLMANKTSSTLLAAMKKLDFQSPVTHSNIKFTQNGNALAQSFLLFNMQGNTSSSMQSTRLGTWKRGNEPALALNEVIMTWKDGSKAMPVSKCSRDCLVGEENVYPSNGPSCCWRCQKCSNLTVSNATNSQCFECPKEKTPNPLKTRCVVFKQIFLRISNPIAEFAIFLMVIGILFTLFCMFILNQNKDCGVVKLADNETMQVLLLGTLFVLISIAPLLLKPSVNVCMAYFCAFNVALTIPLAALLTKTWLFRACFYNSDDSLKASVFGARPGFFVGLIVLLLQIGAICAGLFMERMTLMYDDTDQWDTKYVECSSFRGYAFWFTYGFNMALSILINFFNCGVPDVEARFGEYNWLCVTSCIYYVVSFMMIVICFSVDLVGRVEGVIVVTVLHAYVFLFAYIYPKLHMVLFMDKDKMTEKTGPSKPEHAHLMYREDEDEELMQMVAHAGGGDVFKQKNMHVRVQEQPNEEDDQV